MPEQAAGNDQLADHVPDLGEPGLGEPGLGEPDLGGECGDRFEELARSAPGQRLAGMLAGLDLGECNGHQLVEVAAAARRQIAHMEALCLKAVNELAYCSVGDVDSPAEREERRNERTSGVLEAHLGWSRWRARSVEGLSWQVVEQLPATGQALDEGIVEVDAARAVAEGVAVLGNQAQQQAVESRVLAWIRAAWANGRRIPAHQVRRRAAHPSRRPASSPTPLTTARETATRQTATSGTATRQTATRQTPLTPPGPLGPPTLTQAIVAPGSLAPASLAPGPCLPAGWPG